ncbi:EF-hand calcium-binding domain-containing protein 5 [Biomphalaria pfeifferi]|uniref:EF-hand calcium-binding domain-containing protein 5 n=1 Tax=Biomphalaria pfeifferi TaxID=112525 RepID=A0AAD8BGT7_BIOPF|nr:EF-hand calcium-binding domain-containing protein 5 [Biomphalaria pfeifferi]
MENLCGRKGQQAGGYSPPAPRSASKRWKNLNEQNMMLMLENKHLIKKKNLQKSKEQAREIIRKIPVEVLAKEWLSKEDATVDMRAYLVDHASLVFVLPTLILGVEKLLKVVDEKGLSATNRYEPEFNPINYLAQYLMRNNPRFSNFSEASPYVRGLREVSEEIKQELFTFEDNRLARIKAEARRKRAERERVEQQQQEAKLKRMEQLLKHFQQWSVPVTNNKVELAMVQNALLSFCEMAALWPKEMREAAKFGKPLDPTDETGNMLSTEEFAQYLTPFVEELSMDIFEAFMIHMNKCAANYRAAAEKEVRRNMLTNLFLMCDHGKRYNHLLRIIQTKEMLLGLLDRQRILELFEKFWDTTLQNKEFMGTLRNPRRFPVIEVEEVDDSMFDAWEDEPDGGLTVTEMQIASAEMARVQQEVHRLATIATVQDKSAVEKWKIKQLSEKSEGMRWKLYKYNVTDFLNIFEYNYFDTLEAPKQNLNLQERIESGNMRHHDLHLMTISRTKEERDTVLGRVKVLDSEEVSATTLDQEVRDKHDSDIDNINDNREGKEIGQSVNNNCNMADETSCGSEQEETGNRITYAKVQNVGDECNSTSVSTQVIYYSNQSCRDVAQRKPMEDIPMVKHKCKMKDTNNNMAKFREGRTTDSSSDTDTTVTELGLYSNSYTNRKDESNEYLESEFLTSDESLTVNDQNASDATYEESDEEVWFEKLSQLRKTLANVLPVQPHTLGPVRMNQQTLRTESRTLQHSTELASMEHSLPPLHKSYNVDRSTSPFQPLPPISTKKHVRFQSVQSTVDKGSQSMDDEEMEGQEKSGETNDELTFVQNGEEMMMNDESEEIIGSNMPITAESPVPEAAQSGETQTLQVETSEEADESNVEAISQAVDRESKEVSDVIPKAANSNDLIEQTINESEENTVRYLVPENSLEEFDKAEDTGKNLGKESLETEAAGSPNEVNDKANEIDQNDKERESKEKENVEEKKEETLERSEDKHKDGENVESEKELAAQKVEEKEKDELDPTNDQLPKTSEMNRFDSFMQSQQEISKTGGSSISSANNVEHNAISTNQRSQSQLSAFDENTLNISQFVLLVETLLGHDPSKDIFERLVKHIRDGYSDTEQEKMDRLVKTRKQVISAKRKLMIDNLFEKWDNDGSGYLEMEEIQDVLFKYKDGQELDVIRRAQNALKKKSKFNDQRLSKQEFRELIELLVKEMSGPENFELLVEFLMNSVERSYAERIRGEARKKWLQQIISEGHVSGKLLDPVYKAVFQALYKDAEMHGGEKRISANIAMLEINRADLSRGPMLLRYAACTPEDCPYMLGKCLFKNMKGVSFQAVETGKPVHVPRVSNHGNIYFWNYNRPQEEKEGSLVVIPLKDKKKRVFGVMGIDTVQDSNKKSIFITHEIQFFQGVAKAFSIAYHTVEMKRKLLRVADSAISWMNRRCPHITEIIIYLVEPNLLPNRDPVLRKMMVAKKGPGVHVTEVVRLERKDNLFRDYLFQCMENSETVCADAYGERHTALPLRDLEGKAIGVVDISIGEMKQLPSHENKEAQRMLRLLQKAVKEIVKESQGEEKKKILDAENDEASRVAIMFDSLMLAELRENVSKLDIMAFAELKSYYQPPKVILEICRAALAIFDIERAGEGQYEDWPIVKNNIHSNLIHQIKTYDPTKASEFAKTDKIARYLRATFTIPHGEVGRYGSIPAMLLYNWVFCCLSLIEHTVKMREMEAQNESAPPPEIKPSIMK